MIDSHAHLHFQEFDDDREEILDDISSKLEKVILPGVSHKDNLKAQELAETQDLLEYCIGAHPLHDSDVQKVAEQVRKLEPVAVGEIGLDHHYITDRGERKASKRIFREMLEIAEGQGLGAVVHSRNAEKEAFQISQSYDVPCFFHCFNGKPGLAEEICEAGHFVGVTAQVVDSSRVKSIVDEVSIDSLLIETDSPYLGLDGRNTPETVFRVAEEVSEIKDVQVEEVDRVTSENAESFFRF